MEQFGRVPLLGWDAARFPPRHQVSTIHGFCICLTRLGRVEYGRVESTAAAPLRKQDVVDDHRKLCNGCMFDLIDVICCDML